MMVTSKTNLPVRATQSAALAEPLSREVFDESCPRLFPMMLIEASPQLLASRKVRFQKETDDLDDYRVSRFKINGVFALLQRYATSERNQLNLFVDMDGCVATDQSPEEVSTGLLAALGLGEVSVIWTNSKLQAEFAQLLQKPSRVRTIVKRPVQKPRVRASARSKKKKAVISAKTALSAHSY